MNVASRLENILDMLGTIRRLERSLEDEADPRTRYEIALTLDMLNPVFDRELAKLQEELKRSKAS